MKLRPTGKDWDETFKQAAAKSLAAMQFHEVVGDTTWWHCAQLALDEVCAGDKSAMDRLRELVMKPTSAADIVKSGLRAAGFDGLYCPDVSCGCGIEELAPCDQNFMGCKPAYAFKSTCAKCDAEGCEGRDESDPTEKTCYGVEKK
jgi:hypothetical protein